jgi:2-methylcitrate dehydratase PrpD
MNPPPVTRVLARRVAALAFDDLPRSVVDHAKACLLDWIGAALCGSSSPTAAIALTAVRQIADHGRATLVGARQTSGTFGAAFYNGAVAAVDEIDDVHQEASLHPSIVVIPAALAMAEGERASGRRLLTAVVAGYEMVVRVARAAGPSHYAHWHTTGTCGTFGAAAAAGSILGLDPAAMTMALGLAGTQAAGLWESLNDTATMAKHLHSAKAASSGILAGLLAREGLRGSPSILEGPKGFLAAAAEASPEDLKRLTVGFGRPFLITRNFFKRYACCRAAFEGVEVIERLRETDPVAVEAIQQITVTMKPSRLWLVSKANPATAYDAKFSLPFCMALMAHTGRVAAPDFTAANRRDPAIRRFMQRIALAADPACPVKARIEVRFRGERAPLVAEPVCRPPQLPDVARKFAETLTPLMPRRRIEQVLAAVDRLDRLPSLTELSRLLAAPLTRRLPR